MAKKRLKKNQKNGSEDENYAIFGRFLSSFANSWILGKNANVLIFSDLANLGQKRKIFLIC